MPGSRRSRAALTLTMLVAACGPSTNKTTDSSPTRHDSTRDSGPTTDVLPTDSAADTDTEPTTKISASCGPPADNALRVPCTITVSPPQPVTVSFTPTDGSRAPRTLEGGESIATHEVLLTIMPADTEHTFEVTATLDPGAIAQGTFTSGSVPEAAQLAPVVTGSSTASTLLVSSPCPGATVVIIDGNGEVLWYQDVSPVPQAYILATSYTEDDTILVIYNNDGLQENDLLEIDLAGTEIMRLEKGVDRPEPLHHDAFRRDGRTYSLFVERVVYDTQTLSLDGFYVFDDQGAQIGKWHLADHFTPNPPATGGYSTPDVSHGNSIWVDEAGDIYVGLRNLSAFMKVAGVDAPDFGAVRWRLAGDLASPLGTDFELTASVGADPAFEHQHNVHQIGPNRFALFDNGVLQDDLSRVITLTVDETASTADIDGSYSMTVHCDFQGSAWFTAAGNPIGNCAPENTAREYDVGTFEAPRWTLELNCASGADNFIPRFVPLTL